MTSRSLSAYADGSPMSWPPQRDRSVDVSSCSSILTSESAVERYNEAKQRAEAAEAASPLPTATAVPNYVRAVHDFVKVAAARHAARDSGSASAAASSVDTQDHAEIVQAVESAEESARAKFLEEEIFRAGVHIQDARVELVAAEAHEASECAEWQDRYYEEVRASRDQHLRASSLEDRLANTVNASAVDRFEVDCWKMEAAECSTKWEADRRRLLGEIRDLRDSLESTQVRELDCELKVEATAEAAAKTAMETSNFEEELASAHAEERLANLQAQAADAARAVIDEKGNRLQILAESVVSEEQATWAAEAKTLAMLLAEVRSEAHEAAVTRAEMAEFRHDNLQQTEAMARLEALQSQQRADQETANRLHSDASHLMEYLAEFVEQWRNDKEAWKGFNISDLVNAGGSANAAMKHVEEHVVAQTRTVAAAEASAVSDAATESAAAASEQRKCAQLQTELLHEAQAHRDLHGELLALSSAAASARAVVAAKDETIADCESESQKLAAEMAAQARRLEYQANQRSISPIARVVSAMVQGSRNREAVMTEERSGSPSRKSWGSAGNEKASIKAAVVPHPFRDSVQPRLYLDDPSVLTGLQHLQTNHNGTTSPLSIASTNKQDVASSSDRNREIADDNLSTHTSTSEPRIHRSGSIPVHPSRAKGGTARERPLLAQTQPIPGAKAMFSAFQTALQHAETNAAHDSKTNEDLTELRAVQALEPTWEQTQKVMTDQLRQDILQLRKVFLELGVPNPLEQEDCAASAASKSARFKPGAARRTASPVMMRSSSPRQARVHLRAADVDLSVSHLAASMRVGAKEAKVRTGGATAVLSPQAVSLSKACRTAMQGHQLSAVQPLVAVPQESETTPTTISPNAATEDSVLSATDGVPRMLSKEGPRAPVPVRSMVLKTDGRAVAQSPLSSVQQETPPTQLGSYIQALSPRPQQQQDASRPGGPGPAFFPNGPPQAISLHQGDASKTKVMLPLSKSPLLSSRQSPAVQRPAQIVNTAGNSPMNKNSQASETRTPAGKAPAIPQLVSAQRQSGQGTSVRLSQRTSPTTSQPGTPLSAVAATPQVVAPTPQFFPTSMPPSR